MRAFSANVVPVSSGSGKIKLAGGLRGNSVGRKQFAHFPELARIVGGDDH